MTSLPAVASPPAPDVEPVLVVLEIVSVTARETVWLNHLPTPETAARCDVARDPLRGNDRHAGRPDHGDAGHRVRRLPQRNHLNCSPPHISRP